MTGALALAQETISPDEGAVTADFIAFLKAVSLKRFPTGPMRRFNQGRASGCVEAEFTVLDTLPTEHRVGLFAEARTYSAWIRFANATSQTDRDRDVRGMSIKLRDVPGGNLTPGATTQDFILNSHPVMMSSGPRDFLELLRATEAGGVRTAWYFLTHPQSARIALAARQHPTSHLDIPYWSTTPYLFGPGRAVKYIARPSSPRISTLPSRLTDNYLHDAMADYLARSDASFDFLTQFQADSRTMPIEDAAIEWKERESPYLLVARIRIRRQELDAPGRADLCEQLSFNPWNCLVDHRPLGGFNRARREIYRAMAEFRHERAVVPKSHVSALL
jgi:hypothetical protein